jgi:hypothetical protein
MATPQELIAADDARKAREKAVVVAKARAAKGPANDNDLRKIEEPPLDAGRPPDGYLDCGGSMMPYWLDDATRTTDERATA